MGELKPHQVEGVTWLARHYDYGVNALLCDDMGLGKTVQAIGLLAHLHSNGVYGPFLVVAPLSTLVNWEMEIKRWCPALQAMVLHHPTKKGRRELLKTLTELHKKNRERMAKNRGTTKSRSAKRNDEYRDFPVIITSCETVIKSTTALARFGTFRCLVVDEAHRLKNDAGELVSSLNKLSFDFKALLTGTPLQNSAEELWSLLRFIQPDLFQDVSRLKAVFDLSALVGSDISAGTNERIIAAETNHRMVSTLHSVLHPFILRRVKADVDIGLPAKREIVLFAPMTQLQERLSKRIADDLEDIIPENGGQTLHLGGTVMELRKICNHTELVTRKVDTYPLLPGLDELLAKSGKMGLLHRLLCKLKEREHRVLIFSQFTMLLDLLDYLAELENWKTLRIDGATEAHERHATVEKFNSSPEYFICLLSTRAGGVGINLTGADTVIIYDSDWNPQMDLQAMDRAHRIGQLKPVLVLRLCTSNSVEVKLLRRAQSKVVLESLVIARGAFRGNDEDDASQIPEAELQELLKGTAVASEAHVQSGGVDDAMLDKLLDRKHLVDGGPCPYQPSGMGYQVVVRRGGCDMLAEGSVEHGRSPR